MKLASSSLLLLLLMVQAPAADVVKESAVDGGIFVRVGIMAFPGKGNRFSYLFLNTPMNTRFIFCR